MIFQPLDYAWGLLLKKVVFKIFAVLLGIFLGLALGLAISLVRNDFVAPAVRNKLEGGLPELTWGQVFAGMPGAEHQRPWMSWVSEGKVETGPCPVEFETPMGPFWGRLDDLMLLDFLLKEQLIHASYTWGPVRVQPGDTVLDVGGHLGTFARLSFRQGAERVVAFEPEPTNIACLKKTFSEEIASGRYVLIEAAAWESDGRLSFAASLSDAAGHVADDGEIEVEAVTLDRVVEELGLEQVNFIKMDIEGAERNALAGAKRTLERFAPKMALCIYHRPDDPAVIPQMVAELRPDYSSIKRFEQVYFYRP